VSWKDKATNEETKTRTIQRRTEKEDTRLGHYDL